MTLTLEKRYASCSVLAWHESGHAVLAHQLGRRVEAIELGFVRDHGATSLEPTYDPYTRAMIFLAGERAERRCISWEAGFDRLHRGSRDRRGADEALAELGHLYSVAELVEEIDRRLRVDSRALETLARRLEEKRTLSGAEVARVLG